jgi:2-hydroxychromene-2-carboxylate isomerase
MTSRVEFFFEFSSPYSYLAANQIGDLCRRHAVDLEWKPILLGPIFRAFGKESAFIAPATSAYARTDVERCARRLGISFRFSPHFPLHTVAASRGFHLAREKGREEVYVRTMFHACWAEGRDPKEEETLRDVAKKSGLDADRFLRRIEDPAVKAWLRREVEEAQSRRIFGAPITVLDGEMFHGHDRLPFLEEALQNQRVSRLQERNQGDATTAYNRLLGSHCVLWEKGKTRYEMNLEEQHLNRRGVAHGGAVASLLDTALGAAVVYG